MNQFFDAFISYGRRHSKDFATKLHARLVELGYRVWFDQEDIPPSVDYQQQIDDGIERAHNFLFIISPYSVESVYCAKEVDLALRCGKRIIPLLHVRADRELMNPELRKRNWIYFQDGDDFEKAFQDLVGVFETQREYVHQHTALLARSLAWERHNRQTQYLLMEAEREQAEVWLRHRFQNALPPCTPSHLHCEYITKSIQDAHNGMTQVFLSYAREDKDVMEKVRRSLQREGITVWTNTTDIQTGQDFQQAIRRGIEEADNLVYLLSPESLQSKYCQEELEYALSLNKRVIPIRAKQIAAAELPDILRNLHFVDLTDNQGEQDYLLDERQLLNVLQEDATYYEQHKISLVEALRWERQQRDPNFLQWGYNLRMADAWLGVALRRSQHPPIPIQVEFIEASRKEPAMPLLDAFIFYPRSQVDFARKLNKALQNLGKRTWFDRESIASGADLQQEIYKGIKQSDNFICILSPNWRDGCPPEVEYALKLNKRFVSVRNQEIELEQLPQILAGLQWIDFCEEGKDFTTCVGEVETALEVDREHVVLHTKWLQRSLEWEEQERSDDLLLRGSELEAAEQWLIASVEKEPEATLLQAQYIQASRKAETARQVQKIESQRLALAGVIIALITSLFLGAAAMFQSYRAAIQEIRAIALSREVLLRSGQTLDSLVEGIRARQRLQKLPNFATDERLRLQVRETLQQAIYSAYEYNRFRGKGGDAYSVAFSPDGEIVAASRYGNVVNLWQRDGTPLVDLKGHESEVQAIAFSPDGKILASASADTTVKLWQQDGKLLATLEGHSGGANGVAFSPDGEILASASSDTTVKVWGRDGTLLNTLVGHGDGVGSVAFSPDSQLLASASNDGTVKLWQRDGKLLATLEGDKVEGDKVEGDKVAVNQVAFSPDGQTLAAADNDGKVKLWRRDGTLLNTLSEHEGGALSVAFSPDGQTLVTGDGRGTVRVWQNNGRLLNNLQGHGLAVYWVTFSPDGRAIASASADTTVRLWQVNPWVSYIQGHTSDVGIVPDPEGGFLTYSAETILALWKQDDDAIETITDADGVFSAAISPDGQTIASANTTNTVEIRQRNGTPIRTITNDNGEVWQVAFSPNGEELAAAGPQTITLLKLDGTAIATLTEHKGFIWTMAYNPRRQTLVSGSDDGAMLLWQRDGTLARSIANAHEYGVTAIAVTLDGETILSGGWDGKVKLWRQDGTPLSTLGEHEQIVTAVAISPDGQWFATASTDKTVRLWRRDGTPLIVLRGRERIVSVAFSTDGQYLAAGDEEGGAMRWNLSLMRESDNRADLRYACDWVKDYLSHQSDPANRNLCADILVD